VRKRLFIIIKRNVYSVQAAGLRAAMEYFVAHRAVSTLHQAA
jgi:hypothetical protein